MTVDDLLNQTLDRARQLRDWPESTYRFQFNAKFTFRDATALIPYLAMLGVTHVYASPYLKARQGSMHGYDVIDHSTLNPELGSPADYDAFVEMLAKHKMSHILDTVPNHVGIATNENAWWNDVLARGRKSKFAKFFDITWTGAARRELEGKVLLPTLGAHVGDVLDKGELKVSKEDGGFVLEYYDRKFPLDPETQPSLEVNGDPEKLDALLSKQNFRLAYWKTAPDEINYRRFFDVNDLAALAMEHREVFDATHAFTLKLLAQGKVSGLRVDHPDGLFDPEQYFYRLQRGYLLAIAREITGDESLLSQLSDRLDQELPSIGQGSGRLPLYVLAEKILAMDEPLMGNWAVHGTSGYDFLNMVNGLFVDESAESTFTKVYHDRTDELKPFAELAYQKKKLVLERSFASELHMLALRLDELAQRDRHSRDFTLNGLRTALREVIVYFPVYRSYISDEGVSEVDRKRINHAIDEAVRRNPLIDRSTFDFIRETLFLTFGNFDDEDRKAQRRFAGKFQQVTSPVTAKGIEDTTFYIYNRLLSLNEVGGEPARFGIGPDEVHQYLQDRQRDWPLAMSTLSTHDTKRSEDVRARLNVLSEMPEEWGRRAEHWSAMNARFRKRVGELTAPDPNEEYGFYQLLVGAWPLNDEELPEFRERLKAYAIKALREAKVHTSWTDPNEAYESAVQGFLEAITDETASATFLADFKPFQKRISEYGFVNSLSQTVLKLLCPGVPDTYQGMELWDFSLVDPDNRRPVDYACRQRAIESIASTPPLELLETMEDGRVKMLVHSVALRCRRENPGLFTTGDYLPLESTGVHREHVFAFARRLGTRTAIVAVPRLVSRIAMNAADLWEDQSIWQDTKLQLPGRATYRNLFTGKTMTDEAVSLNELFADFPVAVYLTEA